MALRADEFYAPERLPEPTDEQRTLIARVEARRIALMGDQQLLRQRYEQIMRWLNPPWDEQSGLVDPRPELAAATRNGESVLHVDLVNPSVDRWAVLQMGVAPSCRVKPSWVRPPVDDPSDPVESAKKRSTYGFDRAMAQAQSTQMENQTQEWADHNNLHRTLLWAAWCKEAFGKSIIKTGWDPDENIPTAELYENPSTVYYGWSKRYGNRKLSWAMVVDEYGVEEANRRFNLDLPVDSFGALQTSSWTGVLDRGDLDQRPEQQNEVNRYVTAVEYYELAKGPDGKNGVSYALILGGRVIDGPRWYPWKKVPFHVFENQHVPTYPHGKSTAEVVIPINASLDDTWDRQHQVIEFESGPRYKGMGMLNSGEEVDIPDPFNLVPLRDGEDIAQLDTRVDFFPSELHSNQMFEGLHRSTGLTPIAWGMSPNAQTSGRAMSAEWRAVELPLTGRIVNIDPEIRGIYECWWDYAEEYLPAAKEVAKGYRRFEVVWALFDIRDRSEKTTDIIARLNANLIDIETAIQESGYENVDEIKARIESYLVNPVWNPLRYQQLLTLQQLELAIRQQQLQVAAMEQQAAQQQPQLGPGGAPPASDLQQQGNVAAVQQSQQSGGTPATVGQNQPGQIPGGPAGAGGIPVDTSILSQTPLESGAGSRVIVNPAGGPAPAGGVPPR